MVWLIINRSAIMKTAKGKYFTNKFIVYSATLKKVDIAM